MPKSVCNNCEVELRPEENGVIVAEMFRDNQNIYKIWSADLWKCPICGIEVVLGFATHPFAEHFSTDCKELLENLRNDGKRIIFDKEVLR